MSSNQVVVVTAFIAGAHEISHSLDGGSRIDSDVRDGLTVFATRTGTGWAVETWHGQGERPEQSVALLPDVQHLAQHLAAAVAATVTGLADKETPG